MKYSSTPWRKFEHSWDSTSIADSNGNIICSLSIYDEATEENQQELEAQMDANAKLIKAAPDLLEALEVVQNSIETTGHFRNSSMHEMVKRAIAKATGTTNI